jgi:hypothetical protein
VRLLYHAATVKASGNVDNEVLIGRAQEDHRFGFRRANIFRHYQADLGLLLRRPRRAAAAPPQALLLRHPKIEAVVRGEWSPQPRVTQLHSIFNSNKPYIYLPKKPLSN